MHRAINTSCRIQGGSTVTHLIRFNARLVARHQQVKRKRSGDAEAIKTFHRS